MKGCKLARDFIISKLFVKLRHEIKMREESTFQMTEGTLALPAAYPSSVASRVSIRVVYRRGTKICRASLTRSDEKQKRRRARSTRNTRSNRSWTRASGPQPMRCAGLHQPS